MRRRVLSGLVMIAVHTVWSGAEYPELPTRTTNETAEEKVARMQWWTDGRFGMFIQVRELLTRYGKIDIIWYDSEIELRPVQKRHSQGGDQIGAVGGLRLPVRKPPVEVPVVEMWISPSR